MEFIKNTKWEVNKPIWMCEMYDKCEMQNVLRFQGKTIHGNGRLKCEATNLNQFQDTLSD